MNGMWFWLGVLCGGVLFRLPRGKRSVAPQAARGNHPTRRQWAQTRNFLYYDGTEMPIVKEDLNEQ
ncbi:MAG: hypothetical protein IJN04_01755 [Clostridia bacterium]|nr:hypothetical protein [Clostridia bacterium]